MDTRVPHASSPKIAAARCQILQAFVGNGRKYALFTVSLRGMASPRECNWLPAWLPIRPAHRRRDVWPVSQPGLPLGRRPQAEENAPTFGVVGVCGAFAPPTPQGRST